MYQALLLGAEDAINKTGKILGLMKLKTFLWRETHSDQKNK